MKIFFFNGSNIFYYLYHPTKHHYITKLLHCVQYIMENNLILQVMIPQNMFFDLMDEMLVEYAIRVRNGRIRPEPRHDYDNDYDNDDDDDYDNDYDNDYDDYDDHDDLIPWPHEEDDWDDGDPTYHIGYDSDNDDQHDFMSR